MGYSIHAPCKSKKARDQMFAFLKKNYRPFSVLAAGSGCLSEIADQSELDNREWKHTDGIRGPLKEDMSYVDDGACYIGFDFGMSGGGQGTWMKDFCRWVATKVGSLHQFEVIEGKVPYIIYDIPEDDWDSFDSVWPVLERSEFDVTKDMESFVVDRGFRGWAQQVRVMREHSKAHSKERSVRESWSDDQYEAHFAHRKEFWKKQMRIAKRADKYIKAELARLDKLWEDR